MAAQLGDFGVDRQSATQLSIGANCSSVTPCVYRLGGVAFRQTAPATITIVGASSAATVLVYISGASGIVAGQGAGISLICSGCSLQAGVASFPADSIPLASWTANSVLGQWDSAGTDLRGFIEREVLSPGVGLMTTANSVTGATLLAVDQTVIGIRAPAPTSSTSVFTAGAWAEDLAFYYVCVSTNTWRRAALTAW